MKKLSILIVTVFLLFNLVFPFPGAGDVSKNGKEFVLTNHESPIYLSFETYKMKDGWTPVILSPGKIQCRLWMDIKGNISEFRDTGTAVADPVCVIDMASHCLKKDGRALYFDVYEQNNVRTRWILSSKTSGKLAKKMFVRENGIDVCLGNMKLTFNYVSGDVKEFSPGLLRVKFHGAILSTYRDLVYEKDKGIFYSAYEWKNKLISEQSQSFVKNPKMLIAIPPQERAALIALYNSTNGDRWVCNDGWKTPPLAPDGFALPGTEQNWVGITCDPVNSTVQMIDLKGIGLNGTLPSELGNLNNLQYLNLDLNRIHGVLPPGIGNLANLKSLRIELNELTGPLPPELGNLTKLEELYLPMNCIDGSIPPEIGNMENLKYISLYMNRLEGNFPSEIGNLHNLIDINLECNGISGNLPPELGNLVHLENLQLPCNMISGTIPPELGKLINLQTFNIAINELSGPIPPELGNLINLKGLFICFNQISGNIPPGLGNLINLEGIDFSCNQISGSIPPEFGNLVNLIGFYSSDNLLNGSIPPELGNLLNLQSIFLNGNQLSGSLPPELGNLTNLYVLNLFRNQLSGSIPSELAKMVNLEYLKLDENRLSGSIPPEFGNMLNLEALCLDANRLSGNIPPELKNMAKLEILGLNRNQLSGSIPPELAEMPRLWELRLNENQFNGNIPWQLGNALNLRYLWLKSNKLSGDIPLSLTNLRDLSYLDFRWNALYTNDSTLRTFLNRRQEGRNWESTQTIAPLNVTASVLSPSSVTINWTPIIYTAGTGGYRVYYSTTPGGPYTYSGMTADKTASSLTVTGLKPCITYYFVVKTRTNPHVYNENTVDSEYSSEAPVFLPPVMLTSPNGGENWPIRTVQKITWDSLELTGKIRIELWKANEKFSDIAGRFPVANGSYTWLVGNHGLGLIPPGNDYKIKIITLNGLYSDISSECFSIVN